MCTLVKKNYKVEEAQEDLVFYKHVIGCVTRKRQTYFRTPFRYFDIVPGKTYNESGLYEDPKFSRYSNAYYEFGKGYFHLYENLEDAKQCTGGVICAFHKDFPDEPFSVVLKAIVPKGTKFVRGNFCGSDSILTTSVRYELIEEIKVD